MKCFQKPVDRIHEMLCTKGFVGFSQKTEIFIPQNIAFFVE